MASWQRFTTTTAARRGLGAAATTALLAIVAGLGAPTGCTLSTDGIGGGTGSSSATGPTGCAMNEECDDQNRCTDDLCIDGMCSFKNNDNIIPNDMHPCTDDKCMAGVESHPNTAPGTPCGPGSPLTCDGAGNCPPCSKDSDCGMEMPDKCTKPQCVSSTCKDVPQMGKKLTDPTPHDCMGLVCDPSGVAQPGVDTMDAPTDDGNDCTDEICDMAGKPHPPSMMGAMCSSNGGKVCDGMGACVGCLADTDCTTGTSPTCDTAAHACISCSDGLMNGSETGTDCGGSCPLKCGGATCGAPAECKTGHCADSVCCDTDCTDTCKACNLPGMGGTCSPVAQGSADPVTCQSATQLCDGAGGCKLGVGQACALLTDCFNGACAEGFCKVTKGGACTEDAACASSLCSANVCADCSANAMCASMSCMAPVCQAKNGEPCKSNGDCVGGKCVGFPTGLCKLDPGDNCTSAVECASGYCNGGKCMTCMSNAVCPPSMPISSSCGASGCTFPPGWYCVSNSQCASGQCKGFPAKCM